MFSTITSDPNLYVLIKLGALGLAVLMWWLMAAPAVV